jgi:TRAP-type C4-dicarboxylate transport system permease large subunit
MTTLVRSLWPYILVEYGVLLIITYLPDAILWLPRLFGY